MIREMPFGMPYREKDMQEAVIDGKKTVSLK